jgi:hypothetical protein
MLTVTSVKFPFDVSCREALRLSSVSIVTGCTTWVWFPALLHSVQIGPVAYVGRTSRADHPPPLVPTSRLCSHNSTPPICLHGVTPKGPSIPSSIGRLLQDICASFACHQTSNHCSSCLLASALHLSAEELCGISFITRITNKQIP